MRATVLIVLLVASGGHHGNGDHCTQIWMAAISLDDLASGSFAALWLPFQDYTAHNHIAQWVDSIVMRPPNCAVTADALQPRQLRRDHAHV